MKTSSSLLVVLCACSGTGGGNLSFRDYETEGLKATCAMYARCNLAVSAQACDAYLAGALGGVFPAVYDSYEALIASGKFKFDGAKARRCLDSYGTASCDALNNALNTLDFTKDFDCAGVLEGGVQVGGACGSFIECAPDTYCDLPVGTSGCSTCKAKQQAGATTNSVLECVAGLTWFQGKCAQPLSEGATCSSMTASCASGSYCDGTCKKFRTAGETCATASECGFLRSCTAGKCGPPPSTGQSCATGSTCQIGLRCDTSGGAVCAAPAALGSTCSTTTDCQPGLACTGTGASKMCAARATEGQSCSGTVCSDNLYCESGTQVCKAQRADGAACMPSEGSVCKFGGSCQNGVCRSLFSSSCP